MQKNHAFSGGKCKRLDARKPSGQITRNFLAKKVKLPETRTISAPETKLKLPEPENFREKLKLPENLNIKLPENPNFWLKLADKPDKNRVKTRKRSW